MTGSVPGRELEKLAQQLHGTSCIHRSNVRGVNTNDTNTRGSHKFNPFRAQPKLTEV